MKSFAIFIIFIYTMFLIPNYLEHINDNIESLQTAVNIIAEDVKGWKPVIDHHNAKGKTLCLN